MNERVLPEDRKVHSSKSSINFSEIEDELDTS